MVGTEVELFANASRFRLGGKRREAGRPGHADVRELLWPRSCEVFVFGGYTLDILALPGNIYGYLVLCSILSI